MPRFYSKHVSNKPNFDLETLFMYAIKLKFTVRSILKMKIVKVNEPLYCKILFLVHFPETDDEGLVEQKIQF